MLWRAIVMVTGLWLLPVAARSAGIPAGDQGCPQPLKVCTYEDLRWGCGGEKLRNLLEELKCLDARVQKLDEPAAVADIGKVNPRLIATALRALGFLATEDWKRIYKTNVMDEKVIAAIRKYQKGDGDGWLRSDELVKLVCEGARGETGVPYLKYYLGWMYATGQGVLASGSRAHELLQRAEDVFRALNKDDQYTWYLDHISTMLRKVPYDGGEPGYSYCPDFNNFTRPAPWGELDAQLKIPLPMVGLDSQGNGQTKNLDLPPIDPKQ